MENYFNGISGNPSVLSATKVEEVRDFAKDIQAYIFATTVGTINEENVFEKLTSNKLGLKNVKDANKKEYAADIAEFDGKETYDDVQKVVDAINARVDMTNATTKAEMRTALVTVVEKIGSDALDTKTTAEIDDLAEEFLSIRDDKDLEETNKLKLDTVENVIEDDFDKVERVISGKLAAINNAYTAVTVDDLEAIVGKGKVKAGMLQDFINASNKDHKKEDEDKYNFENYAQVRKALGL